MSNTCRTTTRSSKIRWVSNAARSHRNSVYLFLADLTTLKNKVLSQKFKTICDFIRDVNKIFNNCRQFNAIDSTFSQCANVVDNFFRQLLENFMMKDQWTLLSLSLYTNALQSSFVRASNHRWIAWQWSLEFYFCSTLWRRLHIRTYMSFFAF